MNFVSTKLSSWLKALLGGPSGTAPEGGSRMRELTTIEELEARIGGSTANPVFLFKHSTACPTSARANGRVSEYLQNAPETGPEICMIKVIESRPVSNAAAERLAVPHQSPQLLLVSGGKAVWATSHYEITGEAITQAIEQHLNSPA